MERKVIEMSHMAPRKLLVTSCLSWYLRWWRSRSGRHTVSKKGRSVLNGSMLERCGAVCKPNQGGWKRWRWWRPKRRRKKPWCYTCFVFVTPLHLYKSNKIYTAHIYLINSLIWVLCSLMKEQVWLFGNWNWHVGRNMQRDLMEWIETNVCWDEWNRALKKGQMPNHFLQSYVREIRVNWSMLLNKEFCRSDLITPQM